MAKKKPILSDEMIEAIKVAVRENKLNGSYKPGKKEMKDREMVDPIMINPDGKNSVFESFKGVKGKDTIIETPGLVTNGRGPAEVDGLTEKETLLDAAAEGARKQTLDIDTITSQMRSSLIACLKDGEHVGMTMENLASTFKVDDISDDRLSMEQTIENTNKAWGVDQDTVKDTPIDNFIFKDALLQIEDNSYAVKKSLTKGAPYTIAKGMIINTHLGNFRAPHDIEIVEGTERSILHDLNMDIATLENFDKSADIYGLNHSIISYHDVKTKKPLPGRAILVEELGGTENNVIRV